MGVNDAREQLEVAIEEFGKLERELASVKAEAVEMEHRANRRINEVVAERDAALAVIEQAKERLTDTRETSEMRNRDAYGALTQSPASALAKVKADALRHAAKLALGPSKWLRDGSTCRQIANDLQEEADRIEREEEHGIQ